MNTGDRVRVKNHRSGWFGSAGIVRGQRDDGRHWVEFGWLPFWQLFWPEELRPEKRQPAREERP